MKLQKIAGAAAMALAIALMSWLTGMMNTLIGKWQVVNHLASVGWHG